MNALDLGLAIQDRQFGFQVRRLNINHQAPFKPGTEPFHQTRRLFGSRVAGQHNLLLVIVQLIERMEKLFLCSLFPRQDLHIVHQQHIGGAVVLMEERHPVGSNALDKLVHEALGGCVNHPRFAEAIEQRSPDRMEQVGLAHAGSSIDEQRVVAPGRLLGHGSGRGMGELVGAADDKVGKVVAFNQLGGGAKQRIADGSIGVAGLVGGSRFDGDAVTTGGNYKLQLGKAQLQIAHRA